jgi:Zn-dependent M28 family amino/carboxypeptidase
MKLIEMPGTSHRGALPPADSALCELAEELRRDIRELAVDIGERNVRHRPQQLARAADYIEAEFAAAGYAARRQEYNVESASCCNLDVEIAGATHPEQIVVIGGHYDTVPGCPGANDNTSGAAATLALARRFAGRRTERTLRFVAFVNEEHPYGHTPLMGSRVYARRCRERGENVIGMMSLETIGYYDDRPGSQKYPPPVGAYYPSEGNFIAFVGNVASAELVRQAVGAFRSGEPFPCEGAALPESIGRIGDSDHASFWQEGYMGLMVTDTANFRYPYYHTPDDTIDKINFDRLARVVRGLERVVAELAGR